MSRTHKTAPNTREQALITQRLFPIVGVDEAGRGPLAGPVVASAVVLPAGLVIDGVYDSKKITPKRRAELAQEIKTKAISYAYGIINAIEIDSINILQATLKAMQLAVDNVQINMGETIMYALIDGNRLPALPCPAEAITKGDIHCHLIAAASILAKEKRDTIMDEMHQLYPQYGFNQHAGYGTATHLQAIRDYGACPIHRKTFKGVKP